MGVFAYPLDLVQTEMRAERQMDGIHKAKERGVHFGQQKKLTPKQVAELQERRKQGELIKTLMKEHAISKATIYRYLEGDLPATGFPIQPNEWIEE